MKILILLSTIAFFIACSPAQRFSKDQAEFEASKVEQQFKSVADLNDSYFELRANNYFEFYRQLFDSVKNSRYPGKYTLNGDTLLLHFYNSKGTELLGSKALIDKVKKEIVFFDKYPGVRKRLIFN